MNLQQISHEQYGYIRMTMVEGQLTKAQNRIKELEKHNLKTLKRWQQL